jgi:hypothetical protein
MYQTVYRCTTCKAKCQKQSENPTRTPSHIVLVEANKYTRKSAKDELDEKIKVWGNAAPPMNLSRPRYGIDLVALEQANIAMTGSILVEEDRELLGLEIPVKAATVTYTEPVAEDTDKSSDSSSEDF